MFSDEYRGFWAETLAECEPEITSAMVIEPTRIRYYEGWDDLIAIAPDDKDGGPVGGKTMLKA